jgi:hypothetical protein
MTMSVADVWRHVFENWPAEIARRGVLVTAFDEQIPFEGFAISERMLLVERRAPDTVGARAVLVAYEAIQAIKIVDVVKLKSFQELGFKVPGRN